MKLLSIMSAAAAFSQAADAADERARIVALFREACLTPEISLAVTEKLADAKGWTKDPELSRRLSTDNQTVITQVWNAAPLAGSPVAIMTSIIEDAGQRAEMCALHVRRFSDPELEQTLASALRLGSPKRQEGKEQIMSGWSLDDRPGAWVWYHSQRLTDGLGAQIGIALIR